MNQQGIISKWKDVGSPTSSELVPNDFDTISNKAFAGFADRVFNYVFRSITTVADQAEYTLPSTAIETIAYTYEVKEILSLFGSTVGSADVSAYYLLETAPLSGVSLIADMYLIEEFNSIKQFFGMLKKKTVLQIRNDKIRVIPTPTTIKVINYLTKERYLWSTVPDKLSYILEDLYCYEQLVFLATKRTNISGVSGAGNTVNYPSDKLLTLAKEYQKSAEEKVERYNNKLIMLF